LPISISQVRTAFQLLYDSIHNREFRKTLRLNYWSERELLPAVRTFLLGYFGHCYPEVEVRLAGSSTGWGRVDFLIGDVAVEFAVRRPEDGKTPLSHRTSSTEIKKLMQYSGPALYVLYDFSANPVTEEYLDQEFKRKINFGRGRRSLYPFNVAYYYIESARRREYRNICKNIRPAIVRPSRKLKG
jgi:hypothetical protein